MERIHAINPERIAWCCADRGMTPEQLASNLGIAAASMQRVMAGEDGITFIQLRKIADYFNRGVLFFLETGPVDEGLAYTPQFRTLANQKPEVTASLKVLIERVEKQRDVYRGLREDLDDESERLHFTPPDLPRNDISDAARATRQWLQLSDENDFDSYRVALEKKGMLVFRSNGYNGKWQIPKDSPVLGFTLYGPACPVIVIKKQNSEPRQSFTLMHELGHLLLHKISSIDDERDMQSHHGREREANAFAGILLVPDRLLASIADADRPDDVSLYDEWLAQPRRKWGVSGEVILRRLLDSGRLPQADYAGYHQWLTQKAPSQQSGGTRQYRYREPIHIFGDTYVRTVLDALNTQHITLTKASSYLDTLKIQDLHRLEQYYAGL